MKSLKKFDLASWDAPIPKITQDEAIQFLERGKVLYFPSLPFKLLPEENQFLDETKVDPKKKNISYDLRTDILSGSLLAGQDALKLKEMIKRYAQTTRHFLELLFPHYTAHLIQGRTSFRPAEIYGRKSSVRKDDTRLHVDAFPSSPTKGQRILRVFANINPEGKPRVWRVGEPFENVVNKFACHVSKPFPGSASILKFFGLTKTLRTPYDHYMLNIHDKMKEDDFYQKTVSQEEVHLAAGTSWIVYTDQVSHAAMSGQHMLEQTFYIPLEGLLTPATAPQKVLERYFNRALV